MSATGVQCKGLHGGMRDIPRLLIHCLEPHLLPLLPAWLPQPIHTLLHREPNCFTLSADTASEHDFMSIDRSDLRVCKHGLVLLPMSSPGKLALMPLPDAQQTSRMLWQRSDTSRIEAEGMTLKPNVLIPWVPLRCCCSGISSNHLSVGKRRNNSVYDRCDGACPEYSRGQV